MRPPPIETADATVRVSRPCLARRPDAATIAGNPGCAGRASSPMVLRTAPSGAKRRQPSTGDRVTVHRQRANSIGRERGKEAMWKGLLLLGIVALVTVLGSGQSAAAAVSCHGISATGVGHDLGNGNTTAQISDGGVLQGTTVGSFVVTDSSDFPVLAIAGTVTFTTNKGTLTVSVAGTLNVSTGDFTASGPVSAATGKLTGATGSLTLAGNENLITGVFTETITGNICVDLSK